MDLQEKQAHEIKSGKYYLDQEQLAMAKETSGGAGPAKQLMHDVLRKSYYQSSEYSGDQTAHLCDAAQRDIMQFVTA